VVSGALGVIGVLLAWTALPSPMPSDLAGCQTFIGYQ
jgi:hypothetical protein